MFMSISTFFILNLSSQRKHTPPRIKMAVQPNEMTIAEQVEQAGTLSAEPAKAEELYRAALSRKAGMSSCV
jgi:hypothetical protein